MHEHTARLFDTEEQLDVSDIPATTCSKPLQLDTSETQSEYSDIKDSKLFTDAEHREQKDHLREFCDSHVDYLDVAIYTIETHREDVEAIDDQSFNAEKVHSLAWEVAEHWVSCNVDTIDIAARMEIDQETLLTFLIDHIENKLHKEIDVILERGRR